MQRRNNMVNWWMATAQEAGYEKLFPGLMTYFYTAEYYDANIESISRTVQGLIKAKRPIKGFLHMGASILDHDTWDRLGEIKAPTLLMGGEEDIITPPRHMQAMAEKMPSAEARMFAKTLHGFMVEKPETFAMIPEFFRAALTTTNKQYGEETMRSQIARAALAAALAAVIASAAQAQQAAQSYPNRSIKMILPFAAGGAGDTFARPLAQALSQSLGQPVVIENIVGAAAVIGTQVAARAPADGYTLLMVSNALAIAETMSPKRGYVLMREFTPLTQLNALSLVLVVNPKMQVKNVAELIAMAKAQPGKLNYASSGVGSIYHLPMEHLKTMAGIDLQHVPYKSSSQARMDVIAGEPSMMMDALATMQGQIKANQVRALGVASLKRTETAPDLPAIAETVPGYSGDAWLGFMAPAGTPPEIVSKLQQEIAKVLARPDVKAAYRGQDAVPVASTPAEFGRFLNEEIDKWGKAIRNAGIPIQD